MECSKETYDLLRDFNFKTLVLTLEQQEELLNDSLRTRSILAGNLRLDASVQRALSVDVWGEVRRKLAGNPTALPDLQEKFLTDADPAVRADLAGSGTLSPSMQMVLAEDRVDGVRGILAANRILQEATQVRLSFDKHSHVKYQLAMNSKLVVSTSLSASFLADCKPEAFLALVPASLQETARGLATGWNGSVASLVEAAGLVQKESL